MIPFMVYAQGKSCVTGAFHSRLCIEFYLLANIHHTECAICKLRISYSKVSTLLVNIEIQPTLLLNKITYFW